MKISPAEQSFILHWGDMGVNWGMSRSTCQIHALLYLSTTPLNAEDIANSLQLARSNVSTSLKELLNWNLVAKVPIPQERRDHFVAEIDVWEIARRIAIRRKELEIDPALKALRKSVELAEGASTPETVKRLNAMLQFTEKLDAWYTDMQRIPRSKLEMLLKFGSRIVGFLPKVK